jgi:predicted nuclease of predicted toxin-antitoxin system
MDAHVPGAVTAGLRRRGIDVLTSQEDHSDRSSDEDLLARAVALGRVVFSQDEDMLRLATMFPQRGKSVAIIYAHQLSAGIGALVQDLEIVLSCCTYDELASRVTYLPLK